MMPAWAAASPRVFVIRFAGWSAPIVLTGMLTAGWFLTQAQVSSYKICLIKNFTDLDCPGCGMTRAFLLLARGRVMEAIVFNAASPLVYLFFLQMLITLVAQQCGRKVLDSPVWQQARVWQGWLILVVLLGHWVVKTALGIALAIRISG